jgi:hypothetical protein
MDVENGWLEGQCGDFDAIEDLYPDDFDYCIDLQLQSASMLQQHLKVWLLLARLIHDLGYVHGDDIAEVWWRHRPH